LEIIPLTLSRKGRGDMRGLLLPQGERGYERFTSPARGEVI